MFCNLAGACIVEPLTRKPSRVLLQGSTHALADVSNRLSKRKAYLEQQPGELLDRTIFLPRDLPQVRLRSSCVTPSECSGQVSVFDIVIYG